MTNAKDLAARLRELTRITGYATTKEAADLIEQQAAEIALLEFQRDGANEAAGGWREQLVQAKAEIERLRATLNDIANPIAAWQRDLRPGYSLDGGMCVRMANDPETYKRMAREALQANAAIDAAMKGTT